MNGTRDNIKSILNAVLILIFLLLITNSRILAQSYNSVFPYSYGFESGTKETNGDGYCFFGGSWNIATDNPRTGGMAAYLPSFSGSSVHNLDFCQNFGSISFTGDEMFFFYLASTGVLEPPLPVAEVRIMYSTDGGSTFFDMSDGPSPYQVLLFPDLPTYTIGLGYYLTASIFSGKSQVVFRIRVSVYDGFLSTPPLHLDDVNISGGALPVTLYNFSARISAGGNNIQLIWTTISEVNNYGFEVEKRVVESSRQKECGQVSSGVVEKKDWRRVGFVEGAGTSNFPKEYSFTDFKLSTGRYEYRLKQIDNDGAFKYSQSVEIEIGVPKEFSLSQNYPNPFNPTTTIKYDIPVGTYNYTSLRVYDMLGREVATLVNEQKEAGSYEVQFNASKLASGIYFYRLTARPKDSRQAGSYTSVKKLVLMK